MGNAVSRSSALGRPATISVLSVKESLDLEATVHHHAVLVGTKLVTVATSDSRMRTLTP